MLQLYHDLEMDKKPQGALAGRVGACIWGVGAQARRMGFQLPPSPSEFNP